MVVYRGMWIEEMDGWMRVDYIDPKHGVNGYL